MAHTEDYSDFHIKHLSRLKGGTVQNVIIYPSTITDLGQPVYGLQISMPAASGQAAKVIHVWILCDPEGNGPGFLEIEEVEGHEAG